MCLVIFGVITCTNNREAIGMPGSLDKYGAVRKLFISSIYIVQVRSDANVPLQFLYLCSCMPFT